MVRASKQRSRAGSDRIRRPPLPPPHNFINHSGSIGHTLHGVTNQWGIQAIMPCSRLLESSGV